MQLHHYCLILALTAAPVQSQEKPPAPPTAETKDLGVSLDRIQKALANTPRLRFDTAGRPVFRVQVFGEKPTIDDILGPDWEKGPVKYGTMTHDQFLAMVTPEEFKGFAGYTNAEGAQIAASSLALQWTLQKALRKFRETQDAREREAARKEVMDALNALEAARAKGGRAPK